MQRKISKFYVREFTIYTVHLTHGRVHPDRISQDLFVLACVYVSCIVRN